MGTITAFVSRQINQENYSRPLTPDETFVPGILGLHIPGGEHTSGVMNYGVSRTNTVYYRFKLKLRTVIVSLYISPPPSLPLTDHFRRRHYLIHSNSLPSRYSNSLLCSLPKLQLSTSAPYNRLSQVPQ
jgi:hypothetical protein